LQLQPGYGEYNSTFVTPEDHRRTSCKQLKDKATDKDYSINRGSLLDYQNLGGSIIRTASDNKSKYRVNVVDLSKNGEVHNISLLKFNQSPLVDPLKMQLDSDDLPKKVNTEESSGSGPKAMAEKRAFISDINKEICIHNFQSTVDIIYKECPDNDFSVKNKESAFKRFFKRIFCRRGCSK
jgi:hypothetical protein